MKKNILLVEDDVMLSEMYQEKLEMEGYKVTLAEDGDSAVRKIKLMPDLVLLDIMMPRMNGFDVLKNVKSDVRTKDIPVVVLTNIGSESTDSDKDLAMSLGAEDYLVKSYHTPDEVVDKVKEILTV